MKSTAHSKWCSLEKHALSDLTAHELLLAHTTVCNVAVLLFGNLLYMFSSACAVPVVVCDNSQDSLHINAFRSDLLDLLDQIS